VNNIEYTHQHVVPYNAATLLFFKSHCNVLYVKSQKMIIYVFKYLFKGEEKQVRVWFLLTYAIRYFTPQNMHISEPGYPATPKQTPDKVYPDIAAPKHRDDLRKTGFYFRKKTASGSQAPNPISAAQEASVDCDHSEEPASSTDPRQNERIRDEACENLVVDYNEPLAFREMRIITASECCWLLFEFPLHESMYKVISLL
jgi:hypothetical protein